jgi:hypothetical protein
MLHNALNTALTQAMGEPTCCKGSSWVLERDLGHAKGFEYLLGRCSRCGAPSMSVFCVASGISGYERVTPDDVEAIRSIPDGPELKEFVRRWGNENL